MKVKELLAKYLNYVIYGCFFLLMLNTCSTCNRNGENTKMRHEVVILEKKVDSLSKATYSAEEMDMLMEINGLETSKRTLYDWNAIVRTTVRPDDRMNSYDNEINKLKKQFKEFHKNRQ
jgi:hypothetical protein